jgi:LPS-assembly protein
VEDGARLSLGLTWTRVAPGGEATLALGRVAGGANDGWLAAARAELAGGLGLEARTVWDEDWEPGPTDARLDWSTAALSLEAGFARVPGGWEPDLGGPAEEVSLAAEFRPSERWTLAADLRYDLLRDHPREVGIGVGWRNECVAVDLSASRRYTSAGDEGTTEFGLSVDLLGFSASDPRVAPGACRG